ncbi:MAG: DotA/TraY family protein [Pseudobdellovibrionaceae bacterium]
MVNLLPSHHPCFKASTRHEWGLIRVLAAAADNIELKWKNIDQIVVFAALTAGVVMTGLYMIATILFVTTSTAMAVSIPFTDILDTANPDFDIAFMMMDRTFGVPGVFQSVVETDVATYGPFPNVFQIAMQSLFEFFSTALFLVMIFIFLYHVLHMVMEVNVTGRTTSALAEEGGGGEKGFGWLPLRFIIAFGLLLPISDGLNSAQWITLYTAKFGSGLATNAWIEFNAFSGDNPLGEDNVNLVTKETPPDAAALISQLMLIKACQGMNQYDIIFSLGGPNDGSAGPYDVTAWVVHGQDRKPLFSNTRSGTALAGALIPDVNNYNQTASGLQAFTAGESFVDALQFSELEDIQIVYGYYNDADPDRYRDYPGKVLPVCGAVKVPISGFTGEALFAAEHYFFAMLYIIDDLNRAGYAMEDHDANAQFAVLRQYFLASSNYRAFMNQNTPPGGNPNCFYDFDNDHYEVGLGPDAATHITGYCEKPVPSAYWDTLIDNYYQWAFEMASYSAYDFLAGTDECVNSTSTSATGYCITGASFLTLGADNPMNMMQNGVDILDYGWGGAGLWYNKIAERNGSLHSAINSLPQIEKMPMVMERIKQERMKNDRTAGGGLCELYNPRKSGTGSANNPNEKSQFAAESAGALHVLCTQIAENQNIKVDWLSNTTRYANPVESAMASALGQLKLLNLQESQTVQPMVFLSSIGRALIDKAIFNLIVATGTAFAGGLIHAMDSGTQGGQAMGSALGYFSRANMSFATIGLSAGIVLHYMLPMMPFMYFFFAVGRWVKTIFEAMVGVPLWAMAHMRSGGAGLPGDAAASGYFLLLEIFIRPIVTVFSLVASFATFSALVMVLNGVFTLMTSNLLGVDRNAILDGDMELMALARNIADQFFLSVMYIFVVYLMGTVCFKLIDLIPDNIMRWISAGVSTFGKSDISDEEFEKLNYQLPFMAQSMVGDFGKIITDGLYKPGAEIGAAKKAAADQKAHDEQAKKIMDQRKAAEQKKPGDPTQP